MHQKTRLQREGAGIVPHGAPAILMIEAKQCQARGYSWLSQHLVTEGHRSPLQLLDFAVLARDRNK